jgi:hypothetical protein
MNADVLGALTKLATVSPLPQLLGEALPIEPGWKADNSLQDDLDAVLDAWITHDPALKKKYAFAVVDLTDDPNGKTPGFGPQTPAYAGFNDTKQMKVVSLAKLLPLYGAYRLRSDLKVLTKAQNLSDLTTAATDLRQDYRRVHGSTASRPNIEKIFATPSSPDDINFTRQKMDNTQLDSHYKNSNLDPNFTQLTFREYLRLMAGWSDDISAANVIRALGFDYLWALTNRAGLFRPRWDKLTRNDTLPGGPGGLFLGEDFNGLVWSSPPPGAPMMGIGPSNQAATARSVAMLLTLLAGDRLVLDQPGNVGMREMLRKTNADFTSMLRMENSTIGIGMAKNPPGWTAVQDAWDEDKTPVPPATDPKKELAVSKIGYTEGVRGVISNGLLVRALRATPAPLKNVTITAVLVGINTEDNESTPLVDFGQAMAMKLDARHGATG